MHILKSPPLNHIFNFRFENIYLYIYKGDLCSIEGSGAYCAGMSTKNYNSFPEAPEVMLDTKGGVHVIRK